MVNLHACELLYSIRSSPGTFSMLCFEINFNLRKFLNVGITDGNALENLSPTTDLKKEKPIVIALKDKKVNVPLQLICRVMSYYYD